MLALLLMAAAAARAVEGNPDSQVRVIITPKGLVGSTVLIETFSVDEISRAINSELGR